LICIQFGVYDYRWFAESDLSPAEPESGEPVAGKEKRRDEDIVRRIMKEVCKGCAFERNEVSYCHGCYGHHYTLDGVATLHEALKEERKENERLREMIDAIRQKADELTVGG
jgi:hypothetical protein